MAGRHAKSASTDIGYDRDVLVFRGGRRTDIVNCTASWQSAPEHACIRCMGFKIDCIYLTRLVMKRLMLSMHEAIVGASIAAIVGATVAPIHTIPVNQKEARPCVQ
jgi:hypothetical protein